MRDDMYENRWSPFDPKWYQEAFDKFVSTADQLFNTDLIIKQGFNIPDSDGSRSSVFRKDAVLTNTFNEKDLRETLKDIYLNSSHKLVASNHDNVHFFKWNGYMSDMELIPNTEYCQFVIPTDTFIYPKERDLFKRSQFYRKWISITDILKNWNIFKWHCLLFINQRVYSEYELRIDDHEVTIRFKYYDYWLKQNYPVYIYKFDTRAQSRILVSRELCVNQWDWKVPIDYIDDKRIANATNVMITFNKISDPSIRKDGIEHVEVIGDNIEFLEVKDGYIDLSKISDFNKIYIQSELTEYLWMSIMVPRFFHEYPILLPTESIYQPYEPDFQKVSIIEYNRARNVKTSKPLSDDHHQVYIDRKGNVLQDHNAWKTMIRPIVLADAFDDPYNEPYERYMEELDNLRDLTVKGADIIEEFRFFILDYTDDIKFNKHLDMLIDIMDRIRNAQNAFLEKLRVNENTTYERLYKKFIQVCNTLREDTIYSEWFGDASHNIEEEDNDKNGKDFWLFISPLIYIPRELADKYYVMKIMASLGDLRTLWTSIDDKLGTIRFRRPIDETDFWTFEFDPENRVWRPYPLSLTRHFPDVYTLYDPTEETPTLHRVFKSFFFYSDTMDVLHESGDIIRSTPDWEKDMIEYEYDKGAVYRDIFMEKFYWMGVRSIYKGIMGTHSRWEAIEYVIDNPSYDRFNQLFLNTMDPYFKLGLATYLKSSNYEFPFDDAISKMEESIDMLWNGYKKVTNFEMYLNKTWIPSYFDHIIKIMDNWDYGNRLLRRPRNSFDIDRLLPVMLAVQSDIFLAVSTIDNDVEWIINQLTKEDYHLTIENFYKIKKASGEMIINIDEVLRYTKDLDLEILSIDDINHISSLFKKHIEFTDNIEELLNIVYHNGSEWNVYDDKRKVLERVIVIVDEYINHITNISSLIQDFDMEGFMKAINDLHSYFDHAKTNPDDTSLIGNINKFDDPWSVAVKDARNNLFTSTSILYGTFDPVKSYSREEVESFVELVNNVKRDISALRSTLMEFWRIKQTPEDQDIIDRLDHTESYILKFKVSIDLYMSYRKNLLSTDLRLKDTLKEFDQFNISNTEDSYRNTIIDRSEDIIAALSYIAGKNNKEDAYNALTELNSELLSWTEFINVEQSVFERIFEISEPPTSFMINIKNNEALLYAMMEYMNTVNTEFIPDISWPTYSDVYYVNEVELLSGGFKHNIGDEVFIPNLGSYKITEVTGNVLQANAIESLGYRCTTFRDPMCQSNPYDSITNGKGIGISVKPISSTRIRIINDEVIQSYVMRVRNNLYLISNNITNPNPFANVDLNNQLGSIEKIKSDWEDMIEIYSDYMTSEIKSSVSNLILNLQTIIPTMDSFIECRSLIDLARYLDIFDQFIQKYTSFMKDNNLCDENYYYYDNLCQIEYVKLYDFYSGGRSWNDSSLLKTLLDESRYPLTIFKTKIIDTINGNTSEIVELFYKMMESIPEIIDAINELPNTIIDVKSIIKNCESLINNIPNDLQKDVWYILKYVKVAEGGRGYKVGDIVEIRPELPVDNDGNPIYDLEDVIMNDVILLQVTEIDEEEGSVVSLKPLMSYAIPYLIWGLRDTNTRVGDGRQLRIDCYSYEIELSDSTLFDDANTDISKLPPFDENDMFMFKFENIHDLDINYEVFYGGKQINNFIQRHVGANNQLHPKNIDIIYLNANEVMDLRNSSIYIPAEHYFIYRIDDIEIIDPGAGYSIGQDIFVDVGTLNMKLKVLDLLATPYKEIGSVELSDGRIMYETNDPSSEYAKVATDSLNNIDDEFNDGYYDQLTKDGITKPATISMDPDRYHFTSNRYDNLEDGIRNKTFMYPDVDMPLTEDSATDGDPDSHIYLGSRIDNSQHPMNDSRKWNGIMNVVPVTHPFISDDKRIPTDKPIKGEYQSIARQRIHNSIEEEALDGQFVSKDVTVKIECTLSNEAMVDGDLVVKDFNSLPKHTNDWPDAEVGKVVIVESDETNNRHRMAYKLRTFVAAGFFVWELPQIADFKYTYFDINWMNCDFYPDYPSLNAQYPTAPWRTAKTYRAIQNEISDKKHENYHHTSINTVSYIKDLTIDDISVWNWSTHEWEDLHNEERWKLEVRNDDENKDWGFRLTLLEEGLYSYDMELFLNKVPETQIKNSLLKRDAVFSITASIAGEVNKKAINTSINTGRHLRIRKLFPYEQKETFIIGKDKDGTPLGYEMDFKLAPYIHFRNEIHLEDIKIFNKSAGRFEDIMNPQLFEVRFKDDKAVQTGYETQTTIIQSIIGRPGEGFVNGNVWAWNEEFSIHLFGYVTSAFTSDGHLITFTPIHCPNPPKENIALEFQVYQNATQSKVKAASVIVEFETQQVQVNGDGYIHNVRNRMAPIPNEFKVIALYNLDEPTEYDIIISKSPRKWAFIEPKWLMSPTFHLEDYNVQQNRVYVLTDKGRFPLTNPSTGKPTLQVVETENGTDVTFLNLYRRYEKLEVHTTPYPMRTVYVQRRIPSSGFIDLKGKINKPLNKKYFEFWVNGKLMYDEVTIITPTKIFLHGLKSLKNLEIIEVNRDPNEYFSDVFLEVKYDDSGKPAQSWNYETYLDAALEGELEGDNYTRSEQEYLLSPVWKQVSEDHPEFKNYPPNVDIEDDVLVRVSKDDRPIGEIEDPTYSFIIIDPPTLEGQPIVDRNITFDQFGFIPITNSQIIDILNEIWSEEIAEDPYFQEHVVMSDDEWYGMTARLYDEYGIRVHTLNEAAYKVANSNLLKINTNNKLTRIIKNPIVYDLS